MLSYTPCVLNYWLFWSQKLSDKKVDIVILYTTGDIIKDMNRRKTTIAGLKLGKVYSRDGFFGHIKNIDPLSVQTELHIHNP